MTGYRCLSGLNSNPVKAMDACWQQWPCQQYWRFYHKNHDLLILRLLLVCIFWNIAGKDSRWWCWCDFMIVILSWNFLCCPSLNLSLLTEIIASPSVSPLLAADSIFFNFPKRAAYTYLSPIWQVIVAFCNKTLYSFLAIIAIWFRFSFHNWKCENLFIVIWTVIICWKTLTFGLLLSD